MQHERNFEGSFIANELNLDAVIFKLCHERGDAKWSLARARKAVEDYRRWLFLHKIYPKAKLVPTQDIDEVWHTHILDTMAYGPDCERMFGHFLHHFPYAGMRGATDMSSHQVNAAETARLYRQTFGEDLLGLPVECTNCCDAEVDDGTFSRPTAETLMGQYA